MIGRTVVRNIARAEYAAVRVPLALLDQHVVSRYLDRRSVVRQGFHRAVQTLDTAATAFLQQPEDGVPAAVAAQTAGPRAAPPKAAAQQASTRKATPQKASTQKATPQKATPQKATPQKAAPQKASARASNRAPAKAAARPDAKTTLPADEVEEIEALTEELRAADEDHVHVGELADDDLRDVQTELRAKHLVEEQVEERSS